MNLEIHTITYFSDYAMSNLSAKSIYQNIFCLVSLRKYDVTRTTLFALAFHKVRIKSCSLLYSCTDTHL